MQEKNKPTGGTAGKTSKGEQMQDKDIFQPTFDADILADEAAEGAGVTVEKIVEHLEALATGEAPTEAQEGLPLDIFDNLPPVLRDACNHLADRTEREVFLVGALGVVSGLLPNVRGFYDQQFYGPNLFVYILAPYGSGKGMLRYARALGEAIHERQKEISAGLFAAYREQLRESKQPNSTTDEPVKPGNKMLFVPANNSKSGLIELIHGNGERGILYETESDTLADALKTEHGNFSDLLRKAFHHEPVSFYRRTGDELREMAAPHLAVVLSSTPDQYRKLVPTVQNGLFSRFLHFTLTPAKGFRNVFDTTKHDYPVYFRAMSDRFLEVYEELEKMENEKIEFELRDEHKARFLDLFGKWKTAFGEHVSPDMEGTANRLGLICFRLAMILTALRNLWEGDYTRRMICNDADFENALRLVEVFKDHALKIFYQLPRPEVSADAAGLDRELIEKADKVAQVRSLYAKHKSYRKVEEISGVPRSTVERWLSQKK